MRADLDHRATIMSACSFMVPKATWNSNILATEPIWARNENRVLKVQEKVVPGVPLSPQSEVENVRIWASTLKKVTFPVRFVILATLPIVPSEPSSLTQSLKRSSVMKKQARCSPETIEVRLSFP